MSSKSRSSRKEAYQNIVGCLFCLWLATIIIQAIFNVYYVRNPKTHQEEASSPTSNGHSVANPELESMLASIQAIHDTISTVNQTLREEIATEISKLKIDGQSTQGSYQPYQTFGQEDELSFGLAFFHIILAAVTVPGWIASLVGTMVNVEEISRSFADWMCNAVAISLLIGLAVVVFGVGAEARWYDYVNWMIWPIIVVVTLHLLIGCLILALGYDEYDAPPETGGCEVETWECDVGAGEGAVESLEKENASEC